MSQQLCEEKYDLSLLGTKSDSELGREWGISRERVRQLRKQRRIQKCRKSYLESTYERIKKYLQNNSDKVSITDLINLKLRKLNGKLLTRKHLKEIADELNLEIKFVKEPIYKHGTRGYVKKCRCETCRLANCIYSRFLHKNIKLTSEQTSKFANNYLEKYKEDKSRYKQVFYSFLDSKLEEEELSNIASKNHVKDIKNE